MSAINPAKYTDLQNERGAALLLTMILMLMFSLLTVSLYELLEASTQISGNHRLELRAAYIADAGIEDATKELYNDPLWITGFTDIVFAGGEYTVTVLSNLSHGNPAILREVHIESTGTMSGSGFQRKLDVWFWILDSAGPTYPVATTSWEFVTP